MRPDCRCVAFWTTASSLWRSYCAARAPIHEREVLRARPGREVGPALPDQLQREIWLQTVDLSEVDTAMWAV